MAIGREASERGGVIDPVDVAGLGSMEWAQLVGVGVDHPLVGAGDRGYDINDRWSRVVTTPYGQAGPASDTMATPEGAATTALGHWRDVFNFRGSPLPWLLAILILILFLSHLKLRASGEAGGFGKHLRAGAALD